MAAKFNFDKEMLIKQRFWIMLGVAVALTFGGIICLEFVSADEMINEAKKVMGQAKGASGSIPTQKAIEVLAAEAEKASKSKSVVWSKAYEAQGGIFRWSDEIEKTFNFADGIFATEIKLMKMADPKTWPKDTPALVHGTVVEKSVTPTYFLLKTRDKELKIYDTPNLSEKKIAIAEEKDKFIQFPNLANFSAGRYAAVTIQRGRYFNDPLTSSERSLFAATYLANPDEKIKGQIHPILAQVDPLDIKGNGVVQLKNWLYNPERLPHQDGLDQRFINYVKVPWNIASDFSKGAWVAQEDLWIQKEIYRIIGETNKTVSQFEKQKGNDKDKVQIFKNPYFELHLALQADNSISFTVKNLLNRRQRLDQSFLVKTIEGGDDEVIKISADPLMPKGDAGKKDSYTEVRKAPTDGTVRKGIFDVRQVLTWETAAIKRIDQISIGSNATGDISHGHRTFVEGLMTMLAADKDAADDLAGIGKAGAVGPGGKAGPVMNKSGPAPKAGAGRNVGGGINTQRIAHDLWLARYVEISEQSRRIPVAVSLIIDQDHVDRVLTHFNNSKLRFLETQVLLNYYPGSLQPPAIPDAGKTDKQPAGAPFGFPGPGGKGPRGPQAPASGGSNSGGGNNAETETNMEIVIYGIMTLYQRFPPRANAPALNGAAPAAAAAPTAPAAAVPPAGGMPPPEKKER